MNSSISSDNFLCDDPPFFSNMCRESYSTSPQDQDIESGGNRQVLCGHLIARLSCCKYPNNALLVGGPVQLFIEVHFCVSCSRDF